MVGMTPIIIPAELLPPLSFVLFIIFFALFIASFLKNRKEKEKIAVISIVVYGVLAVISLVWFTVDIFA